jgi:hypothetical protein
MKYGETDNDVENIEAWAEIIEDLLFCAPPDKRTEILATATKNEETARKRREANGGFVIMTAADFDVNSPGLRHWNAIMRLKSLLVQVFARNITNNHSPADAAKLLFAPHRHGTGSGSLSDYIDDLPRPTEQLVTR